MVTLFTHGIYISYKASICSKAFVFFFITSILTFISPLLIAYRSQGFWQKIDTYLEQPEAYFKHDCILYIESGNCSMKSNFGWSTFPRFNRFIEKGLRIPTIKTYENDWNRDGKLDYIDYDITFPLNVEDVRSVEVFLLFDVKFHRLSSTHIEGLTHFTSSTSLPGRGSIEIFGDMKLIQKEPFKHRGRDTRFTEVPLIDPESDNPENFDFSRILKEYNFRNITTRLDNVYVTWSDKGLKNAFKIRMRVNIPEQVIFYRPGFWQVLKWAWVQYFSILVAFVLLFRSIKKFVFQKQILPTYESNLITSIKKMN